MSIEEKAKEESPYTKNTWQEGYYLWESGFLKGANWMLEKAIYWLQEHVNDYLFDDGTPDRSWLKCKSEMFDDFRKAMEK